MEIRILRPTGEETEEYHRMRAALWPAHDPDILRKEALLILAGKTFYKDELSWTVFAAVRPDGRPGGFLELTVYPRLDFTRHAPVGYIEGWYVDPDLRGQGVGRALVDAAIRHLQEAGIREIASDADLWRLGSHFAHLALGFEQVRDDGECAYYRKQI